ncbi:ornithine carbamoyltransferase [bacterium]|nr:ornithine carbamoyltransferase [bacterium]
MKRRDVLSFADFSADAVNALLAESLWRKKHPLTEEFAGRFLALIFEKPSLRTRVSFEVAIHEMGGGCVVLRPDEIQMGKREATKDVARYLSRNVSIAALRVFAQETLEEFAAHATIPVINALSDTEHPCQALADLLTILEHRKKLAGLHLVYMGDGNNVCHSLLYAAALTGMHMTVICPRGYEPEAAVVRSAQTLAKPRRAAIAISTNPADVKGADAIYTDVWASMGQESEAAARRKIFAPYQVNAKRLAAAPEALVLHCLPAHRGEEITDDVVESPQSVVFDQAENRRHAQKAVLRYACGLPPIRKR